MSPKEVIEIWVGYFNAGDAEHIAELYHDDAINHQVAISPAEGKAAIKKMYEEQFAGADRVCMIENLFQDGRWAILEWKDSKGLRGCGSFLVVDGKIRFQRGYWDKLSFMQIHNMPLPVE